MGNTYCCKGGEDPGAILDVKQPDNCLEPRPNGIKKGVIAVKP